jgi:hypothetical protein
MALNRPAIAIASFVCALPCALLALWTSLWYLLLAKSKADFEDVMTLGLYAIWMLPLAIVSGVLACLAGKFRVRCIWFASIYFWGWLVVFVADVAGIRP